MTFGVEEIAVEIPYVKMKGTKFGVPAEYPRYKYHPTDAPEGVVVDCVEDEMALGEGWVDSPAQFGVETQPTQTKFDAAKAKRGLGRPKKEREAA